jgi:uncharacterized protein with PQ loop repeat
VRVAVGGRGHLSIVGGRGHLSPVGGRGHISIIGGRGHLSPVGGRGRLSFAPTLSVTCSENNSYGVGLDAGVITTIQFYIVQFQMHYTKKEKKANFPLQTSTKYSREFFLFYFFFSNVLYSTLLLLPPDAGIEQNRNKE